MNKRITHRRGLNTHKSFYDEDKGGHSLDSVSSLQADTLIGPDIVGIEFDQNNDTWTRIDAAGNPISLERYDFRRLSPWNQIQRVNIDSAGSVTETWGEAGYEHAPSSNSVNVMVQIPKFWYKYTNPSAGVYRFWVANYAASEFTLHPAFNQGSILDYAYISAYEASAYSDDGGTTWYLVSRSEETPVYGNGDYVGLNGNTLSSLNIKEARTYGQNVGTGWQQYTVWGYAAYKLLSMIYLGSIDFQSGVGRGIIDKASGTGFAGEVTGYDSIDDQLSEANLGTAMGTGADGLTPISILWVENPYGNIWSFVDGYEVVDSEYRILNRDGSWSIIGPDGWGAGDYEISSVSPLTDDDGYINNIEAEELLVLLGVPAATAGSSSTYIPDYFWSHDLGENNILRSGGYWAHGSRAGLGCLSSDRDVACSGRRIGARLEFIG